METAEVSNDIYFSSGMRGIKFPFHKMKTKYRKLYRYTNYIVTCVARVPPGAAFQFAAPRLHKKYILLTGNPKGLLL